MTPKDASRLAHRRARALVALRRPESTASIVTKITLFEEDGDWIANMRGHLGPEIVVDERAKGPDPNAALLALPRAFAFTFDQMRASLDAALSEHVDGADPADVTDAPAIASTAPSAPLLDSRSARPRARKKPAAETPSAGFPHGGDPRMRACSCNPPPRDGEPHGIFCPARSPA